jgi:hypothetical protein
MYNFPNFPFHFFSFRNLRGNPGGLFFEHTLKFTAKFFDADHFIQILASFPLAGDNNAAPVMLDPDGAIGFVNMLATLSA